MLRFIFLFLSLLFSFSVSANFDEPVALSIGKVILYEDQIERYSAVGEDPYSYQKHMNLIRDEFQSIQDALTKEEQMTFLWSVMVRSSFGSEYSEMFTEFVYKCCHDEFLAEIDRYLSSGTRRNKTVIHKAEFVKSSLKQYEKFHNKFRQGTP